MSTQPTGPNPVLRCACCLMPEDDPVNGTDLDPATGLCLHCQPCPRCERMGTGCTDERCEVMRKGWPSVTAHDGTYLMAEQAGSERPVWINGRLLEALGGGGNVRCVPGQIYDALTCSGWAAPGPEGFLRKGPAFPPQGAAVGCDLAPVPDTDAS